MVSGMEWRLDANTWTKRRGRRKKERIERKVGVHRKKGRKEGRKEGKEIEIGGEKVKESVRGSRSPAFRINTPTAVASLGIRWVARLFSLFLSLSPSPFAFHPPSVFPFVLPFSTSPSNKHVYRWISDLILYPSSHFLPFSHFRFFSPSLTDQFIYAYIFYILCISSLRFIFFFLIVLRIHGNKVILKVIKNQWNKINTYL